MVVLYFLSLSLVFAAIMSTPVAGDREDVDDVAYLEAQARKTSCGVYFAVCLFGLGASIANNGLWVMMPVSGKQLPEGSRVPHYLLGLLQLGNVSALAFLLTRRCSRNGSVNEAPFIYIGFLISIASLILLALFWDQQALVAHEQHSLVYLSCAFAIAQVTCLAAMTYIPFVARMKATYITAMLLGEACAALLPHVLAIGQGIGTPPECKEDPSRINRTWALSGWRARLRPSTTIIPVIIPRLRFNESIYFFVLTGLACIGGFAFLVIRCIPSIRFEYDEVQVDCMDDVELRGSGAESIEDEGNRTWTMSTVEGSPQPPIILDDGSIKQPFVRGGTSYALRSPHSPLATPTKRQSAPQPRPPSLRKETRLPPAEEPLGEDCTGHKVPSFCLLMLITLWSAIILFGPLSPVKAHACLPVGNNAFLVGTLMTAATPIAVVVIILRVTTQSKVTLVVAFTSLGTILLTYFVALIAFSHESESREDSPIFGSNGELLTVRCDLLVTSNQTRSMG